MKAAIFTVSALIWVTGCKKEDNRSEQERTSQNQAAQERTAGENAAAEASAAEGVFLKDQGRTAEDSKLNEKIRANLMKNNTAAPEAANIHIVTENGAVRLHGAVSSNAVRTAVVEIAESSAGRTKVENDITVGEVSRTTADKVGEEARQSARDVGEGAGKAGSKISEEARQTGRDIKEAVSGDQGKTEADEKITRQIRAALKQDQDKDVVREADDVKISTENGQVKLRGTVTSNAAKRDIALIAGRIAGAAKVDNEIKVAERVGTGPDGR